MQSITCNAVSRQPDSYLSVDDTGNVLLGGNPLSAVTEPEVLLWAGNAVARFYATGQRAPIA